MSFNTFKTSMSSLELEVPQEELFFITPDERKKFFLNLVENFKLYCPKLKMIYGALNYDSSLMVEYLTIFETTTEIGSVSRDMIVWDSPYLYTNRALPAYKYAVRTGQHEKYFNMCAAHMAVIPRAKFSEFIVSDLCGNLSFDKNSDRHWKKPENAKRLIKGMSELSIQYVPRGFRNLGNRKPEATAAVEN